MIKCAVDMLTVKSTGPGGSISPEKLLDWQLEQLRNSMAYAMENSPFYAAKLAGMRADSIKTAAAVATLPFTTAAELKEAGTELLATGAREISRIVTLKTSGTTGSSKSIYFTEEDEEQTVEFFAQGMTDVTGPESLTLVLLGSRNPGGVGDLLARGLERTGRRALLCAPVEKTEEIAGLIAEKKPDCIVGSPVLVHKLAQQLEPGSITSVLLSADYIPEAIVCSIATHWGCEVFTHYGMTESCFGAAVECPCHDGLHIRSNDLYFETVNHETGFPVPPGTWGELVFSTLRRKGMPLLRFRTGDIGRIMPGSCRCGSSLQRLDQVKGRFENIITLPDKKRQLSIHSLDDLLFTFEGLLDYDAELSASSLIIRAELKNKAMKPLFEGFAKAILPVQTEVERAEFPLFRGPEKRTIKLKQS